MNSAVLFREVQRFRQWWLWLVIAVGPLMIWWAGYRQLTLRAHFGRNPTPDGLLLALWLLIGIGLPLLFYSSKLTSEVRTDGIYIRFFPFHVSFQRFPFDSIKHYEARTYRPIVEYGGWGIRYGWQGKAYNVSGNRGIQLELDDGKRILIGTQHPLDFMNALRSRQPINGFSQPA
jgi:Family of unknown function (DUF6141)